MRTLPTSTIRAIALALVAPAIVVGVFTAGPVVASAPHVVISQIQIAGATTTDEFVEITNPTATPVPLAGWRLAKRTKGGSQSNLLTTFPSATLPAGASFLIAHPKGYTGTRHPDAAYSTGESLAANNAVILYRDQGKTILDLVGWGAASTAQGASAPNPSSGQVLQRVQDTNSNAADFKLVGTTAKPADQPAAKTVARVTAPPDAPTKPVNTTTPISPASKPASVSTSQPASLKKREVVITGTIIAEPGTVNDTALYLAVDPASAASAPTTGLRVDLPANQAVPVERYDRVSVRGKWHSVGGEERLKIADVAAIVHLGAIDARTIKPRPMASADAARDGNALVSAKGTTGKPTATGFPLTRPDGQRVTVVWPRHRTTKIKLLAGTEVTVTGVLGQTPSGERIMLRDDADLTIPTPPPVATAPPETSAPGSPWPSLAVTAAGALTLLGAGLYRWRDRFFRKPPPFTEAEIIGVDDEEDTG